MPNYQRSYRGWRRRRWSERTLLLEACCWLGVARLSVLMLPFPWVVALWQLRIQPLSDPAAEQAAVPAAEVTAVAVDRVRCAIGAVSRYTPWQSNCLAQALAASRMLRRRHLPHTLTFGVTRDAGEGLQAHAWLACGEQMVTGGANRHQFTAVALFMEK